jgi:hypothetical protein
MKLGKIQKDNIIREMEFCKVEMAALAETMKRTQHQELIKHGVELLSGAVIMQTWITGLREEEN